MREMSKKNNFNNFLLIEQNTKINALNTTIEQILLKQTKIEGMLNTFHKQMFYFKMKKWFKRLVFFLIILYFIYLFNIYDCIKNFYFYYFLFLDFYNQTGDTILQILDTLQKFIDKVDINYQTIIENQKNILNKTLTLQKENIQVLEEVPVLELEDVPAPKKLQKVEVEGDILEKQILIYTPKLSWLSYFKFF